MGAFVAFLLVISGATLIYFLGAVLPWCIHTLVQRLILRGVEGGWTYGVMDLSAYKTHKDFLTTLNP